jgi:FkbH-like protein
LKTNHFNLTAERLGAEEFRLLLANPGYMVVGLRVSDRFGDSGITGLAIVDKGRHEGWTVDNFLLSCRVIGRTVEYAFLAWLIDMAGKAGATSVEFRHRSSGRNEVARNFLQASGGTEADAGGARVFDVRRPDILPKHFVQVDDTQVK